MFSGLIFTFLKNFALGVLLTSPLLVTLAATITVLGQIVGRKEGWSRFESFYWSFITATTVGYGDVRPEKPGSKIISIVIALVGLTLTGILIAIAVYATNLALVAYYTPAKVK